MAERKKHRGHYKKHADTSNQAKKQEVDESCPVIQMFREFQKELDYRHDKHERIVKLSRDITIESKRTIFLLHRHRKGGDGENLLKEAEEKLIGIEKSKFYEVAKELVNEDPHQFMRAYSAGLQEYIEALSFYKFLKDQSLIPLEEIRERLTFQHFSTAVSNNSVPAVDGTEPIAPSEEAELGQAETKLEPAITIRVNIPPDEYILGIADLTGELMRRAINMVGAGDLDQPYTICTFLQEIEVAYNSLNSTYRELQRKIQTLRQSLRKVETTCYTLKVRGSEIPKHMLVDMISTVMNDASMEEAD